MRQIVSQASSEMHGARRLLPVTGWCGEAMGASASRLSVQRRGGKLK